MSSSHQRVEAAIKAFAKGEIVVVTDDDDRENEGDLFVAASLCTPEKMAFIIRNTSGIVCAPLSGELGATAAARADGDRERRPARHRLHRDGRRAPRAHHRHLGRGAHQHRARARQWQQRPGRFRAPRPRVPADRARGRRADAFGPYRGLHRSLPARRPAGGRRAVRTDERQRHRDARAGGRRLRGQAQARLRLDRRIDRLPAGARQAGGAGRRIPACPPRSARSRAMPM